MAKTVGLTKEIIDKRKKADAEKAKAAKAENVKKADAEK